MSNKDAEIELAKLITEHESLLEKYREAANTIGLVFFAGFFLGVALVISAQYLL